jgi:hypothetical protein
MKTLKRTDLSFRCSQSKILALAAGLIVPAAGALAQTFWQGGTSDYNNPASWTGAYNSGNPNTSNDSGSNNVVLIQPGDAIWFHGDTLAGNNSGTSGAYLTGSTNSTGYPNNGNWLRMGIASGTAGYLGSGRRRLQGTSGGTYSLLTATNLATPVTSWTTNTTGVFNGSGAFSNAIPINVSTRASFFRMKTP